MSRILVIGGGLAGLATAAALAPRGFQITVLESRQRLGGRAGSFTDPVTGQLIDACQHVSMGCCTNFAHFCRTLGIDHWLTPQHKLYFTTPDGRTSLFKADPWPAPMHLGRALLGAHYLTSLDKLRIAYGLARMLRVPPDADPPLRPWLESHWQNRRTIERFWAIVLTSALNESVDRLGLKYARKVFRDAFLRHRDGFTVHVPSVPLGRFYGEELRAWFDRNQVVIHENAAVKRLGFDTNSPRCVTHVERRDGRTETADGYVLAVPFDRVLDLIPDDLMRDEPYFAGVNRLQPSPITSVHLWFDRPVLDRPHYVLVDCLGQWIFNRGEIAPGEWYVQVVVSASRSLQGLGRDEVQRRIVNELATVFPRTWTARLIRGKVVTEHTATFSAEPGVDQWRPTQESPIANLVLAGDWTATGWPATMEGAVRSGYLAAEVILRRSGQPQRILQPDL